MLILFSYLLTALIPIILFLLLMYIKKRRRLKKLTTNFWKNQNSKSLANFQTNKIPRPFDFISEIESIQTMIQTTSLSVELGLIEYIKNNPGISGKEIENYLNFADRPTKALIEVLLAGDVIQPHRNGYKLTERAEVYLISDSPLYQPLPPATMARRFLKIAKSGVVKGTVSKWSKGRSSKAENWALKQHQYSFPLGFALADLNLVKGQNVLDVAGGTGAVCIALAKKNPNLNLSLIELPSSVDVAKKMISNYELSERIKCFGMNMFESAWPQNLDTILFTNIFHDWDDNRCNLLAKKTINSLNPGGIVLIQEALLNENEPGPLWAARWSMAMALKMEGKQFRFSELKSILENVGFVDVEVHPLLGYYSTLKAQKPS